jgi:hypothetical protein
MSVGDRVQVSLEVQIGQAVAQLQSLMTSMKGFQSQITQVKATASGGLVSGDPLRGLTASMTAAETKVSTFGGKLRGLGSAVAGQATSFGVATASIWGAYNAYDSLVKVEIRAETAHNRVATMTTTLATLQARHTEALVKHNLSAEEMAILEERITNTKAKLATAQAREVDLQGDVNEAWAGFASQIGPQVIAAGGSIVQLMVGLNGTFAKSGGLINVFKNAFIGLIPPLASAKKEALLLSPALGGMSEGINKTAFSVKGLMMALGPIALIIAGITLAMYAWGKAQENVAKFQSAQKIASGIENVSERIKVMSKNIDEIGAKPFGEPILDFLYQFGPGPALFKAFSGGIKEANAAMQMTSGTSSAVQAAFENLSQKTELFRAAIKDGDDSQIEFASNALKTAEGLYRQAVAAELAAKSNTNLAASMDKPITLAEDWINKAITEKMINDQLLVSLKALAKDMGITIPAGIANDVKAIQNLILVTEGVIPPVDAAAQAQMKFFDTFGQGKITVAQFVANMEAAKQIEIDYAKAVADANKTLADRAKENAELAKTQAILNASYQESINLNQLDADQISHLVKGSIDLRAERDAEEESLSKLAQQYGVIIPLKKEMLLNDKDDTTAMREAIAAGLDYTRGLTNIALNADLVSKGHLAGAESLDQFVQGLVTGKAEAEVFNAGIAKLGKTFTEHLPPGIELTTEQLQSLIQEGAKPAGQELVMLADIINQQSIPAFAKFRDALDAKSWKEFKKAIKEIDFKGVNKALKDSTKDISEDLNKINRGPLRELTNNIDALMFAAQGGGKVKGSKNAIKDILDQLKDIPGGSALTGLNTELNKLLDLPSAERVGGFARLDTVMQKVKEYGKDGFADWEIDALNQMIANLGTESATTSPKVSTLGKDFGEFSEQALQVSVNAQAAASVVTSWGLALQGLVDAWAMAKDQTIASAKEMGQGIIDASKTSAQFMIDAYVIATQAVGKLFGLIQTAGNTLKIKFPAPDLSNVKKQVDAGIEMFVNFERVGNKVLPHLHVDNKQAISACDNVVNRLEAIDGMTATSTIKIITQNITETIKRRLRGRHI